MNRSSLAVLSFLLITLALFTGGCVVGGTSPTVTITSPRDGEVVSGSSVAVSVDVSQFTLTNSSWESNQKNQGHLLYYMDTEVPTEPAGSAIAGEGTSDPTVNTTHVWENVAPGNHTFSVQLVNNDNTPVNPLALDSVDVFVAGTLEAPPTTAATPTPTPLPYLELTPNVTPTPTPPQAPVGSNVTVGIVAMGVMFNRSSIVVPPCANVTILFTNKVTMPHTVSVYYTSEAQSFFQNKSNVIFDAYEIVGPNATTDYHFKAPCTPGVYWFQCDVHPQVMNGQFIVEYPVNQTPNGTVNRS